MLRFPGDEPASPPMPDPRDGRFANGEAAFAPSNPVAFSQRVAAARRTGVKALTTCMTEWMLACHDDHRDCTFDDMVINGFSEAEIAELSFDASAVASRVLAAREAARAIDRRM